MKNTKLVLLTFLISACDLGTKTVVTKIEPSNNDELQKLRDEDQSDRRTDNIDWDVVSKRDSLRRSRVYELLDSNKVNTSKDYSNAALIFQHGRDTVASGMAVKMMRKAIELDSTIRKWLLAAAIDRDLMRRGKPQIYGTQFRRSSANDPWKRYTLDSTKVTDEERIVFGVETLSEQRVKEQNMNKKKLTKLFSEGMSIDEILVLCRSEKAKEYDLRERVLNQFGYQLIAQEKNDAALKIFELNTELYPESFNTHDSYGECLLLLNRVDEGIRAYEKSLELNPANDNATKVLAELKKN